MADAARSISRISSLSNMCSMIEPASDKSALLPALILRKLDKNSPAGQGDVSERDDSRELIEFVVSNSRPGHGDGVRREDRDDHGEAFELRFETPPARSSRPTPSPFARRYISVDARWLRTGLAIHLEKRAIAAQSARSGPDVRCVASPGAS